MRRTHSIRWNSGPLNRYVKNDTGHRKPVLQEGETVEYKWVDDRGLIEYVESDNAMKAHNDRFKDVIDGIKEKLGMDEAL